MVLFLVYVLVTAGDSLSSIWWHPLRRVTDSGGVHERELWIYLRLGILVREQGSSPLIHSRALAARAVALGVTR